MTSPERLYDRKERIARIFFVKMLSPDHRLNDRMPEPRDIGYGLRRANRFPPPPLKSQRAKKSLVNYGLSKAMSPCARDA